MPVEVLNEDRKYTRLLHTRQEKTLLINRGFTPVVSSNVSAIALRDNVLIVRFHGGATYGYPKSGDRYEAMYQSASKGRYVWRELIKKNVPYYKMSNVVIKDDVPSRDMVAKSKEQKSKASEALLATLALESMISNKAVLQKGIIAGLVLANVINRNATENAE